MNFTNLNPIFYYFIGHEVTKIIKERDVMNAQDRRTLFSTLSQKDYE